MLNWPPWRKFSLRTLKNGRWLVDSHFYFVRNTLMMTWPESHVSKICKIAVRWGLCKVHITCSLCICMKTRISGAGVGGGLFSDLVWKSLWMIVSGPTSHSPLFPLKQVHNRLRLSATVFTLLPVLTVPGKFFFVLDVSEFCHLFICIFCAWECAVNFLLRSTVEVSRVSLRSY